MPTPVPPFLMPAPSIPDHRRFLAAGLGVGAAVGAGTAGRPLQRRGRPHFSRSADGLNWRPAGGGPSFLQPSAGSKLMRDPSRSSPTRLRSRRPGSKGLEYTRTRYGAMRTRDFTAFEDVSARLRCPGGMRPGTAFAVSPGVAAGLDG